MKIFMATMGLDIGGAETHIIELSKELAAQGHEILIASNGGAYVPEMTAAGIRHFDVPMHRRDFACMLRSRQMLKKILRAERPDVVHAHARIPAFLCGTLQKNLKFPFVTTAHGVFNATGLLRRMTNWGQHTLAVSEDIRAYLMREYQLPPEQISLTINGIDTDRFSPARSSHPVRSELGLTAQPVLCHVSRLDSGTDWTANQLLEIAPDLDRAIPGIQLLIVGGGERFEALNQRANEVNSRLGRPCVHMTGPRTNVNQLLAVSDLFVGVSRAALEAMSSEKPVLLGGGQGYSGLFTPEGLQEAQAGNFCCRGTALSTPRRLLQDILAAFCLPQEERERLGAYGRQVIAQYYSVHRMAQDCLNVYLQVKKRKYQVLMSGYYGFSNAGDDAILQSIHEGILSASEHVGVTVLSNDPEDTRRRYSLNALPRFRFWTVIRAICRCDALISGGGSLLQDSTSTRSLLYYLFVIRFAEMMGKPVMLYANGIGPVKKPANRKRVKKAVSRATLVTLRDSSSAQELREMGALRQDIHVTADPVFNLSPASPQRGQELLAACGIAPGTPFAVISVRSWPGTGDFPKELAALCDHLDTAHGLAILFLPMQPLRDLPASRMVSGQMTRPFHLLEADTSPEELMAILGESKLCVSMRLHTLIFAARMSVPCLGLVYDPKVDSYLQELEMPSAGHVTNFHREEAIAAADHLMAEYEQAHKRLQAISCRLAQAAAENDRMLLEMLQQHAT